LFDIALAEQAADAGVQVVVNTAVTSLIKEGDAIKGVKTKSNTMPEIYGRIVIAADGIRALLKGIPYWEKLTRPNQKISSGIKWNLSGVKDIEDDVLELHLGAFSERGFATVAPIGKKGCCLTDMLSMKELDTIRAGHWAISGKFKNCTVHRMTGFSHPVPMGVMLPKRVKEGLMLAGDAGGFLGIDAAVATGKAAGDVAGKAIKNGDVTGQGLNEYQEISNEIGLYKFGYAAQFHNLDQFTGHTDNEIEDILEHGIEI
jgi:flavin-dependent dehydrogenase